jgi:hypothetical protein
VGINIASFPGSTVWQNARGFPTLLEMPITPVPSTQYGWSGKGFETCPFSSQNNPPFCFAMLAYKDTTRQINTGPTIDDGYV